ncbi:MAG: GAF domain-containing sensor histidine kinase [Chloroflexi bacterium]|nr:GAF domain-containing sensor histidine kinase [Chloroflexota bacterium]
MNETKPSSSAALNTLRRQLQSLQALSLPDNGQQLLQTALNSLEVISEHVVVGEEQHRLAALFRVSQVLGTSLDLNEVLNQVMDAVIGLTEAERGFLMLVDGESKELSLRAARNMEQETLLRDDMKISNTVVQTVVESGEGLVTTNAQEDPRFAQQESVVAFSLRSILCSPLRSRGEVIGVIFVDNRIHEGLFDQKDLDLLNAFAAQAAAAIQNARLYTQTDKSLAARVGELENLARITRELNQHLELEHVLATTAKWAVQGTSADQAWLAMQDVESSALRISTGPNNGQTIPLDDPLVEGALQAGTPHVFEPEGDKPALLVTPILTENQASGVLVIESSQPFEAETIQFATRLSNQAAVAIEKSRLYENVQQVSDEKSKFVSVVTHEMRLPMTSIIGYTDLIRQGHVGEINEQQTEFLNVIRNNVQRMSTLVSDLSDISRIESGRLLLESTMLPLHDYVDETIQSMRFNLEEKSQTVQAQVPTNLPHVFADPNRLGQILTNLVSNASKYTPENGEITISARPEAKFIRTEIRDNGIGIALEDQGKIFTQFFRSEDADVRQELGWGLGLNVTKRLVELIGGEIGFESAMGEGSTFWFTLPITDPQPLEDAEQSSPVI